MLFSMIGIFLIFIAIILWWDGIRTTSDWKMCISTCLWIVGMAFTVVPFI